MQIDEKRIREVTKKIGLELTDESLDEPDSSNQPEMFVLKDKNITEIRDNLDKGSNGAIYLKITRILCSFHNKLNLMQMDFDTTLKIKIN